MMIFFVNANYEFQLYILLDHYLRQGATSSMGERVFVHSYLASLCICICNKFCLESIFCHSSPLFQSLALSNAIAIKSILNLSINAFD